MKRTTLLLPLTTLGCNLNTACRARLWAALCLAGLLATTAPPAQAAVTEAWVQRYNGPANSSDGAQALAVDSSGNVAVTGSSSNGTNSDYYTAKYAAANGALLWEQRYNGPANSGDGANAVTVDSSGNVVVAGSSQGDFYTAKYAMTDGSLLWERRYNAGFSQVGQVRAVAVDRSGNVVVTGGAGYDNGFGRYLDFYTAKYAAADGALLWENRYGATDGSDGAAAVAIDGGGNVVVTGVSNNGGGFYTGADYYTAKYAAADGALFWEKTYNGPANGEDRAQAVAVDGSGNVIVTGISSGTNDYDYYTAKYAAADGVLLWEKRYGGPADTYLLACAVAVDGGGNVVATGTSAAGAYLAKYAAADGALLWEKRYDGPWFDQSQTVAVHGNGNVVVAGTFNIGFPSYVIDYYTAKYAAIDGALLWEKRYNDPANGDDRLGGGRSLALGHNGMVAVTGSSGGDYATVVYWENLPPVSAALVPAGVRLRFTGVTGRSYNLERAPAVTGPWTTLATPTAPPGGLIEYVDTNPPVDTAFYRTSTP